jgi:hypothetical protein
MPRQSARGRRAASYRSAGSWLADFVILCTCALLKGCSTPGTLPLRGN